MNLYKVKKVITSEWLVLANNKNEAKEALVRTNDEKANSLLLSQLLMDISVKSKLFHPSLVLPKCKK